MATETADLSALTDNQIVALGRKTPHHYATTTETPSPLSLGRG